MHPLFPFVVTVFGVVVFNIFASFLTARCNYETDAADVTAVRRLDVYDTVQDCEYDVRWIQEYTPWWSLRSGVRGETSDTLRLPCVPFEVRRMGGCYANTLGRPRFHHTPRGYAADFTDVAVVRAGSYMLTIVLFVLTLVYWVSGAERRRAADYEKRVADHHHSRKEEKTRQEDGCEAV